MVAGCGAAADGAPEDCHRSGVMLLTVFVCLQLCLGCEAADRGGGGLKGLLTAAHRPLADLREGGRFHLTTNNLPRSTHPRS